MVRWSAAFVVALLLAGCLAGEPEGGAGPDTGTETATASASTSTSATLTSTASTSPSPSPTPAPMPRSWGPGAWVNGTCPEQIPIMAPYSFNDLAVRTGDGDRIVVLRSGDSSGSKYAVHAEGAEGTRFLAAAPGAVYAAKDADLPTGRVVQYDADLKEVRSVEVGQVGSLQRDGDVLYVGGLGNLTALGLDLQVLDVLRLSGTPYQAKRIDYVTVHHRSNTDAVAYLVDDVVQPFRLYRVDASDPRALAEAGNATVGSSGSPGPQWIDWKAGQWYVETNFMGLAPHGVASSQTATAIGLDGAPNAKSVPLHGTRGMAGGGQEETGYDIAASTWDLPGWAILQGNGSRTFAYVAFQDGVPSHACDTRLGAPGGPAYPAYLARDHSWFVAVAGDQLWYIDHTRGPGFGRAQTLPLVVSGLAVLS